MFIFNLVPTLTETGSVSTCSPPILISRHTPTITVCSSEMRILATWGLGEHLAALPEIFDSSPLLSVLRGSADFLAAPSFT